MPHISMTTHTKQEPAFQAKLPGRLWLSKAVLGVFLVMVGIWPAWGAPFLSVPPSTLSLSMHNQQFSAHIIRAPLKKVLTTLSSYGPLRFIIKGNVQDDLISASFANLSLTESLETLLLGYDYAIIQRQRHPTLHTSEFRSLMEVIVLSNNPTEPVADFKRSSLIASKSPSAQPALWKAHQIAEKHNQAKAFDLGEENAASDFQLTEEEVLQDLDPEVRTLVKTLMQE